MIVTSIRERDRKRSEVLTDEGLRFVLYKAEVKRFHLIEGEPVSEESCREILQELLPKRAKLRAMNLLKNGDYTRQRLGEKLSSGGYPQEIVEQALDYVASYHYIDDERYAESFVRARMGRHSKARIRMDLLARGISEESIDRALEQAYADPLIAPVDPEIELIRKAAAKKHFDPAEATYEERQRFLAAMARRGFSTDKIRKAMEGD